jgi:pyruvate,water dikinase
MFRILLAAFNAGVRHMMSEFSLLVETIEFREIGGWVYQRMVPLGGKDMAAPPAWLMPLLIRVVPSIRSRIQGAVEVIRSDKVGSLIQRWYAEWKPDLMAGIAQLREVNLAAFSDEELDRHIAAVVAFFQRSLGIHTLTNGAVLVTLAEIAFACRDLLGWDDRKTFDLFSGLSERSSEPSRRLAQLAQMARERPLIRNLLERIDDNTVKRLADADRDFAQAFATYQREFGCRALHEVADPTLAETPTLILGLIRDQLVRGYDPAAAPAVLEQKRTATIAEARAALAGRSAQDRERFERALARGELAYPIREDNQFYAVSAPMALMRYAVLELGRRLADHGQIAHRDDVFFLELEEAREALRDAVHRARRDGGDLHSLVARRKAERAWVEAHPGPASYGKDPGPPPSLVALPAEARFLMGALLWANNRVFAAEHSGHKQPAGRILHGIAASPGVYTGPARVIMNESEFARLQPGDVLVCPITSPVWSVLFPSVGALLTDTGGILSHPAIIAREYRVPAVVATGNATRLLHDGQNVTVDGNTGIVELNAHERHQAHL